MTSIANMIKTGKRMTSTRCFLFLVATILSAHFCNAQFVVTVAGNSGQAGFVDGPGASARFSAPHGIACDHNGNIYIADRFNNSIRKINSSGTVSTFAGTGSVGGTDGPGSAASFYEPRAVACDSSGNVYVADTRNYKIRKITPSGVVTTIAGTGTFGTTNGPALVSQFGFPTGICVTPDGTTIYVADHNTHVIRKIFNSQVSDLAGIAYIAGSNDGNNSTATFSHPVGIHLDNNGNILVADEWNNIIRQVSPSGNVVTIAGKGIAGSADGPAATATFNYPEDVSTDNNGNIYITDGGNNTIRKINIGTAMVSTYAGTAGVVGSADGTGAAASFNSAIGISYSPFNHAIYITDAGNETIRKIAGLSSVTITLTTPAVNNTVCFGDSIVLNATTSGFTAYNFMEVNQTSGSSVNGIVTIAPLSAGLHSFTCNASDINGLMAFSQTLSITVLPAFTPGVTPLGSVSFCNGDSLLLSAQAGTSYLWSNGATAQNIYITNAGAYSVTVVNMSGCDGVSASINASVNPGPSAVITPTGSTTVCAGDSVLLNASAGASWLWSNGATTQSIYAISAGNYTVNVSDAGGCSTSSTPIAISNYAGSQAVISPAGVITIVQGDSVVLTSNAASTYLWSNNETTQSIVVNNNGVYTVTISTANGCQSVSSSVQVIVITTQQLISSTGVTTFCEGGSVLLQSFFSQGNQWYFNGLPLAGETNQQYLATDSGYYQVAVFQNNNWIYSDSLFVTVNSAPQVATVSDTVVCSGIAPFIEALSEPGTTIDWYDQDIGGTFIGGGSIIQCPALFQSTTFYAEVTAPNGCKASDRAALYIQVNLSPAADFAYTVSQQGSSYVVLFQNLTQAASAYTWYFNDTTGQDSSSLQQPTYTFNTAGTYDVTLVASNTYGCIDSINKQIIVGIAEGWFIPTTFTPNNDGHNDVFRVRGKTVQSKDLKIFDQWGSMIYEDGNNNPVWNGMVNGQTVQNGTYIYKVMLSKPNAESEQVTGIITVIK